MNQSSYSLYKSNYPVNLDERFPSRIRVHPWVCLSVDIRERLWWNTEAKYEYHDLLHIANEQYSREMVQYRLEHERLSQANLRIKQLNHQIEERNQRVQKEYRMRVHNKLEDYRQWSLCRHHLRPTERELDTSSGYPMAYKIDERFDRLYAYMRKRLVASLERQSQKLLPILRDNYWPLYLQIASLIATWYLIFHFTPPAVYVPAIVIILSIMRRAKKNFDLQREVRIKKIREMVVHRYQYHQFTLFPKTWRKANDWAFPDNYWNDSYEWVNRRKIFKINPSDIEARELDRIARILNKFDRRENYWKVWRQYRRIHRGIARNHEPPPHIPLHEYHPLPKPPIKRTVSKPEPPAWIYGDGTDANSEDMVRGTRVRTLEYTRRLASSRLLLDNLEKPCFFLGGVPLTFRPRGASHTLLTGSSGSGKTTFMRLLMSYMLPLSLQDVRRIRRQAANGMKLYPASDTELSRDKTFQAVVYNAKDSEIPFLSAMGFIAGSSLEDSDLIILDHADSRCFAWDVASDVDDRESISQFAELIVPFENKEAKHDNSEHWQDKARLLISAVIISFRNAARKAGHRPHWNFRDLVNAFRTPQILAAVLEHHDDTESVLARTIGLNEKYSDSVFTSVAQYIDRFEIVAARWQKAQEEGRLISLKHWALKMPHSVLVLPHTPNNVTVNAPLNAVLFKCLNQIFLRHQYSMTQDSQGNPFAKKRYVFIDEVGEAGQLRDLKRMMTEGRDFGVNVVLGLHQISQFHETYGEKQATTILGLCSYVGMLKTGDYQTADWCSKRIGDCLREYERTQNTVGTTKGTSSTESRSYTFGKTYGNSRTESSSSNFTSGVSESVSHSKHGTTKTYGKFSSSGSTYGTSDTESYSRSTSQTRGTTAGKSQSRSKSQTYSRELRQEGAVYFSELMNLPDPTDHGLIGGFFIAPSLEAWQAHIPLAEIMPRLPESHQWIPLKLKWPDDEEASVLKNWHNEDWGRLGISIPGKRQATDDDGTATDGLAEEFSF